MEKLCDTSYYMLSEPCHVARPFSHTAVRQVPVRVDRLGRLPRKRPRAAPSQKQRRPRSILGSVSLAFQAARLVVILVLVARLRAGGATRFEVDEAASEDQEGKIMIL